MADMGMLSFQTPEEVAAARRLSDEQQVRDLSKMSAGEWGNYGLLTSAQSMGRAIGAATGYVDPNEARAQKTQQVMSSPDSDLNTSKGMLAKAAELRTIDPRLSMQLLLKGRELEKQEQAAVIAGRKQDTLDAAQLSLTKLQAAQAEKALRENPNLKEIEVGVAGKPDYRQKMIIDTRDPNTKPVLVGEPYQIAAGVRVDARSAGGGGFAVKPVNIIRDGRAITIDANTGQEIGLTAQYDPVTRSAISSATAIGKSAGEATAAIPGAKINAGLINKAVDDLIAMPGFSSAVGATLRPGAQYIPGTKEADWRAQFKQVQGQTFNAAYETLRGGGQITEYETKSAGAALNAMSSATTERQFIKASKDFKAAVQAGLSKLEARAALQPRGVTASTAGKTVNWGDLK